MIYNTILFYAMILCPGHYGYELTTEKITRGEAVDFFNSFKSLLMKGEIEELAGLIHFPIEGDYSWEIENEDGESVRIFNPYRQKNDFIMNYHRLFGDDLKRLLEEVDFEQAFLNKSYSAKINKKPNLEISFFVDFVNWFEPEMEPKPTDVSFEIIYNEVGCDVCEHGIIYRFQKRKGEIKLVMIQFVG